MVGRKRCDIVDTYWQTETGQSFDRHIQTDAFTMSSVSPSLSVPDSLLASGGHLLTPLPGAIRCKPGSATRPFFGVEPVILDSKTGQPLEGNDVSGVLCIKKPWPGPSLPPSLTDTDLSVCACVGLMRTVYGDHERLLNVYLRPYEGFYFTGDGAVRDKDGYYWITGRVDDTINVSGHRLGSAEIEHSLVQHPGCAEAAVVGFPHTVKGAGLFCYVTMNVRIMLRGREGGRERAADVCWLVCVMVSCCVVCVRMSMRSTRGR